MPRALPPGLRFRQVFPPLPVARGLVEVRTQLRFQDGRWVDAIARGRGGTAPGCGEARDTPHWLDVAVYPVQQFDHRRPIAYDVAWSLAQSGCGNPHMLELFLEEVERSRRIRAEQLEDLGQLVALER